MEQLKIKSLEEVKRQKDKTVLEIKRDFKIQRILIAILIILALIICFGNMKLAIDYEALKQEKHALEELTAMQKSMISDLEENCKDLFVEIENLKFGGNE